MGELFEKNEVKLYIRQGNGFRGFEPRFHSHIEILHVISGSVDMSINENRHTLRSGELSITFPYAVHSYSPSPQAEIVILMFAPSLTGPFEKTLISQWPRRPYLEHKEELLPLFQKIIQYAALEDPNSKEMMKIYLQAVVGEILHSMDLVGTERIDVNTTQKLLIYCSEHYTEDISLKSISQSIFVSQSTITKTFSGKLGCSFRDYINRLRVSKAKYELENTDWKITEIMNQSGFKNQSSFNRIFLEICGITPSECRKRQKQDAKEKEK
jgi:AraC-like DNA-binding protein